MFQNSNKALTSYLTAWILRDYKIHPTKWTLKTTKVSAYKIHPNTITLHNLETWGKTRFSGLNLFNNNNLRDFHFLFRSSYQVTTMDGQWDIVVSSLQDIFNSNAELGFDEDKVLASAKLSSYTKEELEQVLQDVKDHKENVDKSRRVLSEALVHLQNVITAETKKKQEVKQKKGRSFWSSPYNGSDNIMVKSEVAFKLRQKGMEPEWIQCEVTRILGDGTKFEVRDPEPDEHGNPGKTYKATWKDVIQIPLPEDEDELAPYPPKTRVLARYPETTTFYPAEVTGTKRDGRCRLKFEGEEEEGKETEVDRRLVLPHPPGK